MRFFVLILVLLFPKLLLGQNDSLKSFIYDVLTHKINIYQSDNKDYIKRFDSKTLLKSFDYLSQYDTDSVICHNIRDLEEILSVYMTKSDKKIRNKALNLFFDIYRLAPAQMSLPIVSSDIDKQIRTKILAIMADKPYSERELKVLTTNKYNYYKNIYTKERLIYYDNIDTTSVDIEFYIDSLITYSTQKFTESLQAPKCNKEMLSSICAWLYIYEAVPYMEKFLKDDNDNRKIKCYLARLHNSIYENEIINANLNEKYLDYQELAFINTRKSIETMIFGLRIEGYPRVIISAYNKQGQFVTEEIDDVYYKIANLKSLVESPNLFTIKIPFYSYQFIDRNDISLLPKCEEVAKWMEENIDKLEINPNLRF